MFSSKKGVSPLIATVLLISFAVALGAVVMNWAHSLGAGNQHCEQASFEITNLGGERQVCFDPVKQQIRVEIQNGEEPLIGMSFSIVGENGVSRSSVHSFVDPNEIKTLAQAYLPDEYGLPVSLTLQPEVGEDHEPTVCDEKSLVIKNIRNC